MPDLDDLLRPDLATAGARAAQEPDFSVVRRRGLARRRRARAGMAALALVVVAGTAGVALLPKDDASPPPTAPSPSPSPSPTRTMTLDRIPSAQEIVDGRRSTLAWLTAASADDGVRAALWRLCDSKTCNNPFHAVAVTTDGFRTRHLVRIPDGVFPQVEQVGEDAFSVAGASRYPYLLRGDGTRTEVRSPSGERPLQDGEVYLRGPAKAGQRFEALAVDPSTGASHRIPLPGEVEDLHAAGAKLFGLLTDNTYVQSTDGGASWQTHPLTGGASAIHQLVPSAAANVTAVLTGSDGASEFPLESVDRDDAGAWTTMTPPAKPRAYVDGAVVLPGGELLVSAMSWSDPHYQGGYHPKGLYVSNGSDWADLLRALPFRDASPEMTETQIHRVQQKLTDLVGFSVGEGHATTYVSDGTDTYAVTGADASTWAPVRTR